MRSNLFKIAVLVISITICYPALSNEHISHASIRSGLVEMNSINARKAPIRFVKSELNKLIGLKRGVTVEEIKWMDEAPKALKKIYPNEAEYHKKLMDLFSSEKFILLDSHSNIERLLKSLDTNTECALKATEPVEERKCLNNLSQNMWWMVNSYGHINNLRKNSKVLSGEFSKSDYMDPELFIFSIHTNASSINRILDFSNR